MMKVYISNLPQRVNTLQLKREVESAFPGAIFSPAISWEKYPYKPGAAAPKDLDSAYTESAFVEAPNEVSEVAIVNLINEHVAEETDSEMQARYEQREANRLEARIRHLEERVTALEDQRILPIRQERN